jgi:hypothetical protein
MLLKMFRNCAFAAACCLLLYKTSYSQKEMPGFGRFTPEERSLKQCAFDPDAEAVVLLEQASSSYNDAYNLITTHRIRIKVLKESGIERGNIRINYYSDNDFEFVRDIEGVVYNNDPNMPAVSTLDRKLVYTKKLNKYYSQVTFAMPNVKVGSIFEYKYESIMKHYGGLQEWVFQRDIPVALSSYHLTIVPNAEFAYSVYKSPFLPINVKADSRNGSMLYEMRDIPGLRDEAYMGAARDYLQRIKFQFSGINRVSGDSYSTTVTSKRKYTDTWKVLASELLDDREFGTQISHKLPDAEVLQQQWTNLPDAFSKMKAIHDHVRTSFSWNGIYSKYADGNVKTAWQKKTGTSGEINLILINLLKSAGLEVHPLLVSERDNGKVDTTYPYLSQFNKVVAYVTIDNKSYILDGTDQATPSFMIPFELLNTTAFIVDKKHGALLTIRNQARKNLSLINLNGKVTPSGNVELNAVADYYDYSKLEKKARYLQDKKAYEKDFFEPYHAARIDSFAIAGQTSDSLPLHHAAHMDLPLEKSGDYTLLPYSMFTGFEKNPFTLQQRFSDVDFGCTYTCIVNSNFALPDNMVPEALPKSIRLVMPDKSMILTRQVQQVGNNINVGLRIEFLKTLYSVEEYPELQSFYKQMVDLLKEPIVLKTKS